MEGMDIRVGSMTHHYTEVFVTASQDMRGIRINVHLSEVGSRRDGEMLSMDERGFADFVDLLARARDAAARLRAMSGGGSSPPPIPGTPTRR